MKKKFLKKNKGFTMIELLAVITILGVLSILSIAGISTLIQKSKNKEIEAQRKIIKLAAQSYIQFNKTKAPKRAGDTVDITLTELKNNNFLKEDIKDSSGYSCMANSKITVKKVADNKNDYTYTVKLKCGSHDYGMNDIAIPNITANLLGNKESLSDLKVLMNFFGGEKENGEKTNISGYSYTYYSKNIGEKNYKKEYDSGLIEEDNNINTKTVTQRISNYVNINNIESIMIKLQVRNKDGGIRELNSIIL